MIQSCHSLTSSERCRLRPPRVLIRIGDSDGAAFVFGFSSCRPTRRRRAFVRPGRARRPSKAVRRRRRGRAWAPENHHHHEAARLVRATTSGRDRAGDRRGARSARGCAMLIISAGRAHPLAERSDSRFAAWRLPARSRPAQRPSVRQANERARWDRRHSGKNPATSLWRVTQLPK